MTAEQSKLTGVRWSSAAVCQRKAFYESQGAPTTPIDDGVQQLWADRSEQNDLKVEKWAKRLREQGHDVTLEQDIPWACGIGHADLVDHTDRVVAEFTGTKGAELPERKPLQSAGYALFLSQQTGEAYTAAVVSFDPATPSIERTYPVDESMVNDAAEIQNDVAHAIETGVAPDRVCKSPGDNPAHYCPFVDHCFGSWEYPDPTHITDDEVVRLAAELAEAIDERGLAKKDHDAHDARVRALQEQLAARVLHGVENVAGGVMVKITDVAGRESVSLADLRKADHAGLLDELAPFVKKSDGHSRFTVKRIA